MRLSDLMTNPPTGAEAIEATGVTADSRLCAPGDIFVAVKGTVADGHDFIADAVKRGAVAVVAETKPEASANINVPVMVAEDSRRELARLASLFFPASPGMICCVTGTNGKTSTAEFLRQIWTHIGWRSVAIGTLGVTGPLPEGAELGALAPSSLTTPDAVGLHRLLHALARGGVTHAAMETSSHGLHQRRIDGVKIAVAGFTNLTHEHLDYHGDMETYYRAKAILFREILPDGGAAVINTDSAWGQKLHEEIKSRPLHIITIGGNEKAAIRITNQETFAGGITCDVLYDGNTRPLTLALNGAFQAHNAVLAAAMAHASGVVLDHALMALNYIHAAPGRMQSIHGHPDGAMVVVDYAHSPDALANALTALRDAGCGKLGVVFGCGGDRDRDKRPEMGAIAARLADFAIITDDNPRSEDPAAIRAEILAACPGAAEEGDRHQAILDAIRRLGAEDVLLVAGKGHEQSQTIGTETLPFSDEATVRGIIANIVAASETGGTGGAAGAAAATPPAAGGA